MARDFFDKPASGFTPISGTIISDVQLALNAATNGNIDTDGLYGRHTGDSLAAYQTANRLTASGNVTDETWSALMRTDAPPIFERCLQVTASFEGTGFTLVVGNFDGAGITWGIIGFTLLGGELGTVLKTINDSDPHLITQAFGRDADQIMEITGASTSAAKKTQWADSISRGASKYNVAEPWKTYFSDLGKFREVQRVQVARARDIYWAIAKDNASQLGLGEELDYLLMYDIAVQNGGMGSKSRLQKAQAAIQDQRPRTAQAKRKIIAQVVADTITSRYKQDVFDRKTAIAVGKGIVHQGKYDLSAWGFLDGESPASA